MKKQSIFSFLLLSLMLLASACSENFEKDDYPILKLSKQDVVVSGSKDSVEIQITSNKAWKISANQSWVSFSPSNGVGDATVKVVLAKNSLDDIREAQLTVAAGIMVRKLNIIQEEGIFDGEPFITPSVEKLYVYAETPDKLTAKFKVSSNIRWMIDRTDLPDWVAEFDVESGSKGVTEITATFNTNATGKYRGFNLKFKGISAVAEKTLPVIQVNGIGQDSLGIRAMYTALGGDAWVDKPDFTKPIENWSAKLVFADVNGERRLNRITWNDNNLNGVLPPEIGAFTQVVYLGINAKTALPGRITGKLPDEIANLRKLETFYVAYNSLSGELNPAITKLSSLQVCYMNDNQLTGELPANIGDLAALTNLRVHKNNISGAIPESIGNLKNLTTLYLNNNKFNSIAASMATLTKLTTFYLNYNEFAGDVPAWILKVPTYEKGSANLQNRVLNGNKFNPVN